MDIADQAQQFEELNIAQSLQIQRLIAKYSARPSPRGYCLARDCEEPFSAADPGRLYCGPACAERHEKQDRTITESR